MTTRIQAIIRRAPARCSVWVGHGISSFIVQDLERFEPAAKRLVVTDASVKSAAAGFVSLLKRRLDAHVLVLPAGERSKTLASVGRIHERMQKLRMGRDSAVIALGGGVVGDAAGFAAATYKRGIPVFQVPTTLLAMVDSSLGGKVGVDTPYGKNLIGAFHQPQAVYADTAFLRTLSREGLQSGVAEMIKMAVVLDKSFFEFLERKIADILRKNPGALRQAVERSCELKLKIVARDEKDEGRRLLLNFGHTIGHALEKASGYALSHGQAVSMGCVVEAAAARNLGFLKAADFLRLKAAFAKAGLPVKLPRLRVHEILRHALQDKKAVQGQARCVILERTGKALSRRGVCAFPVESRVMKVALEECQ